MWLDATFTSTSWWGAPIICWVCVAGILVILARINWRRWHERHPPGT